MEEEQEIGNIRAKLSERDVALEELLAENKKLRRCIRQLELEGAEPLTGSIKLEDNTEYSGSSQTCKEPSDKTEVISIHSSSDEEKESSRNILKTDVVVVNSSSDEEKENSSNTLTSQPTSETEVLQLQVHLKRMVESNHSTNEELQATIQELSDLQNQLDQTKTEKDKFKEEKGLLLESLCRQTERLQIAKEENKNLQKLLHESASDSSVPDREKKLIELLKKGQTKRESMIAENNDLLQKFNEAQRAKELTEKENISLRERVRELKVTVEDVQLEKTAIEEDLNSLKEENSQRHFEVLRLNVLLDIEEKKVKELMAAQAIEDENELMSMMSKLLREKELAEKQMAELDDLLKRSTSENEKLKSQIKTLHEQAYTLKNDSSNAILDLKNIKELHEQEMKLAHEKIENLESRQEELIQQHDVLTRDLKNMSLNYKETEEKLTITINQLEEVQRWSSQERERKEKECEELKKLHNDLLIAVRVATDIKTECQAKLEKAQQRVQELENAQTETKKEETVKPLEWKIPAIPKTPPTTAAVPKTPPTLIWPSTTSLKMSRPSLQCVNVKSIIETIENANKQKPDSGSGSKAGSPLRETNPLPLREQPLTPNKQTLESAPPVILGTPSDEIKDPLLALVEKNGGSKRNALLKWVQSRLQGYPEIELTNFSSSWTDGLALCALLHTYLPSKIPYNSLTPHNKQHNFYVAFSAAESVGIPTILSVNDMTQTERPDWQKVMAYVKEIYTHFEGRDAL